MTPPRRPRPGAMIPAATTGDRLALVPTNPRVKAIAFRFRWRVETVIARVARVLPSVMEQRLYLHVASAFRIHPETIRKLLDVFLGPDGSLRESDLDRHAIGENLLASRFEVVVDQVECALRLLDKHDLPYERFGLVVGRVAWLVEAYGDYAEEIVGVLVDQTEALKVDLGFHQATPSAVVFGVLLRDLCERLQAGGVLPVDVADVCPRAPINRWREGDRWNNDRACERWNEDRAIAARAVGYTERKRHDD